MVLEIEYIMHRDRQIQTPICFNIGIVSLRKYVLISFYIWILLKQSAISLRTPNFNRTDLFGVLWRAQTQPDTSLLEVTQIQFWFRFSLLTSTHSTIMKQCTATANNVVILLKQYVQHLEETSSDLWIIDFVGKTFFYQNALTLIILRRESNSLNKLSIVFVILSPLFHCHQKCASYFFATHSFGSISWLIRFWLRSAGKEARFSQRL